MNVATDPLSPCGRQETVFIDAFRRGDVFHVLQYRVVPVGMLTDRDLPVVFVSLTGRH